MPAASRTAPRPAASRRSACPNRRHARGRSAASIRRASLRAVVQVMHRVQPAHQQAARSAASGCAPPTAASRASRSSAGTGSPAAPARPDDASSGKGRGCPACGSSHRRARVAGLRPAVRSRVRGRRPTDPAPTSMAVSRPGLASSSTRAPAASAALAFSRASAAASRRGRRPRSSATASQRCR